MIIAPRLLFADDLRNLLILTKGSVNSITEINRILDLLAVNTGLAINRERRKIIFSKGCRNKDEILAAANMPEGKLPLNT